jgi:hypothetical protein
MIGNVRLIQWASAALATYGLLAGAPASAQGVKIGILNDQSGVYADYGARGRSKPRKWRSRILAAACSAKRSIC